MRSEFWLGTNRIEIFAFAFEGSTVFAPSPMYPPQIPFTSKVGRIPVLSMVVYPFSPHSSSTPKSSLYTSISKGASFKALRCSAESSATSS